MNRFDEICAAAARGLITRRSAIRFLMAAGASLPMAKQALSASAVGEPQHGGRLRVGFAVGSSNDTLDPHRGTTAMDQSTCANMYNRLVMVGPDLGPVPELAVGWKPNDTADHWVFELRQGVTFHDGRTFNSADAVYSILRMIAPETASPVSSILSDIDPSTVKADGDRHIEIGLVRSNADLPSLLGDWHAVMVPDGHTDFSAAHAVGTGPFMIHEFSPGRRTLFRRNGSYWRDGMPYVDELENIPIPDQAARANALIAGEIDLLEGVDPSTIDIFDADPSIQLLSKPSGAHRTMPMHTDTAPYNDNRVRLALKLIVDRQQMIDVAHKGHATLGNDHPISILDQYYCADLPQRERDPDKAKFLLREAGAENLTFDLSTAPVITGVGDLSTAPVITGVLESALLLREQAAEAGININVVREPVDSYWEAVWMKKPWCVSEWNMRPVPDMMFSMVYTSDAQWNETHFRNERFDKLLIEARVSTDHAKRKELYCEIQSILRDEGGAIIPYFLNLLDASRENVRGVNDNPMGPLGQWRMETIWFDT